MKQYDKNFEWTPGNVLSVLKNKQTSTIIEHLESSKEPQAIEEIIEGTGNSKSFVTLGLMILRKLSLVNNSRGNRFVFYEADKDRLNDLRRIEGEITDKFIKK